MLIDAVASSVAGEVKFPPRHKTGLKVPMDTLNHETAKVAAISSWEESRLPS